MNLFIHGTGIISPAGDSGADDFLSVAPDQNADHLLAKEPGYTAYIPPMQLRRMGKAVRMGIGASRMAMADAGIEKPDALSLGTAMGCLHDTEVFLSKMVEQDEQMLTPTAFIQSTHNTVAGQIALLAGCNGHNLTYTQRGHSFEHAAINAQLYLNERAGENMLLGGIDELTPSSLAILRSTGVYQQEGGEPGNGSIGGEGAAFFLISQNALPGTLRICDISTFTSKDISAAAEKVNTFLRHNSLSPADINVLMSGKNGDLRYTGFYEGLENTFHSSAIFSFKNLCGEYATASAFGLALMSIMTRRNIFPSFISVNGKTPEKLNKLLLINNHMHYYSIWLLEVTE